MVVCAKNLGNKHVRFIKSFPHIAQLKAQVDVFFIFAIVINEYYVRSMLHPQLLPFFGEVAVLVMFVWSVEELLARRQTNQQFKEVLFSHTIDPV